MHQLQVICRGVLVLLFLSVLAACSLPAVWADEQQPDAIYTVQAKDGQTIARAVTHAAECPQIVWDEKPPELMALRVGPSVNTAGASGNQPNIRAARFDVRTCEALWPAGVRRARIGGRDLPQPSQEIRRIVLIADTGCRMKASERAFQECNDTAQWPFAQIAQQAAALKPDLVVHIGDLHYRESPCPADKTGCRGSPWGYGDDAWSADFFRPAQPLLAAAPWLFVRGNHESCWRAGQGWFRFIDAQPWSEARSCNDPKHDQDADFSEPYAVRLAASTQFIVFDSSKTSGKPLAPGDLEYKKYAHQLKQVADLAQNSSNNFFLSHHPLLAYAPAKTSGVVKAGGNAGLMSVFSEQYPQRLFPASVNVALHGHIHAFEMLAFQSDHPVSLVLGNSGSAKEGDAPARVASAVPPYSGAIVEDYATHHDYGFATLDPVGVGADSSWRLTEYNVKGQALVTCMFVANKSRCQR